MYMGLPIVNTRAKLYSTSVIEITFLLIATFIYKASPNKKKPANSQTTKTDAVSLNIIFSKLRMRCTVVSLLCTYL